ncbi:MAG: 30S ribosomal protein S6 [Candidatus Omnitrophica bacterium]|nr:30S ribosomal protein S6 [Candidatus Omnitrophota bacterium]
MNRTYEALVILKAIGTEAEQSQAVARVEEPVKKLSGQIDLSSSWGRRRFAYRIARQQEGYYHWLRFRLDSLQLDELKRLLQLNESIVRYLILTQDEAALAAAGTTPPVLSERSSAPAGRHREYRD